MYESILVYLVTILAFTPLNSSINLFKWEYWYSRPSFKGFVSSPFFHHPHLSFSFDIFFVIWIKYIACLSGDTDISFRCSGFYLQGQGKGQIFATYWILDSSFSLQMFYLYKASLIIWVLHMLLENFAKLNFLPVHV